MKKQNLIIIPVLLIVLSACSSALQKGSKTISIKDFSMDSTAYSKVDSTGKHEEGDVTVERFLTITHKEDTIETMKTYEIVVYKTYNNLRQGFHYIAAGQKDFDKATYSWANDSMVNIDMFNSPGNEKGNIKLTLIEGDIQAVLDSVFWIKFN
jgi:hypothetical protein